MKNTAPVHTGRHFLQIPGPTNVPDRVLHAVSFPTIDHRGPEFATLGKEVVAGMKRVFQTQGTVVMYPSSGTGAWEAALVNTLSSGDKVLMFETGQFATLWRQMAGKLGIEIEFVPGDWRHGVDPAQVEEMLSADREHRAKAVCIVHNETSTGGTTRVTDGRAAIDRVRPPALFMVDTISSLASIDYRHDEWKVDVTVAGSQKGLMLPPGLGFNAISEKALKAAETAKLPRSYWAWRRMLEANKTGFFPYTPGTNLLYGLNEAVKMLLEEGLENVFARHDRHAEATRRAVHAWGLEVQCAEPRHYSSSLTAVRLPEGHSADSLRATILEKYNMSLGNGLGMLKDRVFRIGHLGDFGDLQLLGTLGGVEMGLRAAGVPHKPGGVQAAIDYLAGNA